MKIFTKTLLGLALAFLVTSSSAQADLLIDDFTINQSVAAGPQPVSFSIGGSTFERFLKKTPVNVNATLDSNQSAPSLLSYANFSSSGAELRSVSVLYNLTGGVGLNFATAGTGFAIENLQYISADLSTSFTLSVNGSSSAPVVLANSFAGNLFIPFTSFGGLPDFTNVTTFTIDSVTAPGNLMLLTLGAISIATPEPSSLLLAGLGLASLAGYGYRRRSSRA